MNPETTTQHASRALHVDRAWVVANPDLYRGLSQPPECCPVCLESFADRKAYSPLLVHIPSSCTHFACQDCWEEIRHRVPKCPLCREDVFAWTQAQFGALLYMPEQAIATDDIELLAVVVGLVAGDLPPHVTAAVARIQQALQERRQ